MSLVMERTCSAEKPGIGLLLRGIATGLSKGSLSGRWGRVATRGTVSTGVGAYLVLR